MANEDTIKDLEFQRDTFIENAGKLDQAISILKALSIYPNSNSGTVHAIAVPPPPSSKYKEYDKKAAMKVKLAFVFKQENRFMPMRQIATIMNSIEPNISVDDFMTKLYPPIADFKKKGTIVKVTVGTANVNSFYGSKNWVDADGKMKDEHKYDENQFKNFGEEDNIDI